MPVPPPVTRAILSPGDEGPFWDAPLPELIRKFSLSDASARQRRLHSLGSEGNGSEPDASGIEDGIGEGGADRGHRSFARAVERGRGAVDEFDLNRGNIRESNHRIRGPIDAGDAGVIQFYFFVE